MTIKITRIPTLKTIYRNYEARTGWMTGPQMILWVEQVARQYGVDVVVLLRWAKRDMDDLYCGRYEDGRHLTTQQYWHRAITGLLARTQWNDDLSQPYPFDDDN